MARKLRPIGERRARGRNCIVKGCPRLVAVGELICTVHARALQPVPPATFSHPEPPQDAA